MNKFSDDEIVKEIMSRLQAKDKAYHDLTAMTKKLAGLNERLVESEKVKGHFLSNIRNEINNPLTSVLTMCELIISNESQVDLDICKNLVSTIHREAFDLSFQLRNIFTAAELEAGDTVLSTAALDMDSFLKSTIESFQHRANEKRLNITYELTDSAKNNFFRTDPEKLQSVLLNLLSNAIEYSIEGRPISIRAWKDGGRLNISVTDYGIGIDERDQKAVFERFRQLETGATKRHGGHGLGLSIIKSVLELLGGTITVVSKKGAGAVFTISIPEMAATEASDFSVDGNEFFFGSSDGERF
ncbi:MAG: HAMP domain-containing histidine kinase [Deltaproteobacteria bacterium]|nr:HAMP domain-containing histidine kinase [Deltaproteobacteria bacterium]